MQFAKINGVTLHYQVIAAPEGKPTLVFANSLGTDFRIWRDVIVRLVGDCSIVLYDKRGHGLSDANPAPAIIDDHVNDLAGLLDHLGVSGAVVCGLSVGGLVAQGLAFLRPDLVAGMALCCTAAKVGTVERWNERLADVDADGLEVLAPKIMDVWFTPTFHKERPGEIAGYANMLARQPLSGYRGTCEALRDADLRGAAGQIKVPTICIAGEDDRSVPEETVLELARMIPDARYEVIKNCGHIPCVEQPEYFTEVLKAFLADANLA
jgi:3-oxoadipate enol-lactonase